MSKEKRVREKFPHVSGLTKKRTKFGHRWILSELDSMGRSRSITVKILDNDPLDVFYHKIAEARRDLHRKTMDKDFQSYLKEYFVIKQLSTATQKIYRLCLNGFSFDERQNKKRVHEILTMDIKSSTLKVYVSKINSFFTWLSMHCENIRNPVCDVCIKSKDQPRRRILTVDEMERLKSYARARKDKSYTLFVLLLIETGARVSTLKKLTLKDLSPDGRIHFVNVKSDKDYDYALRIQSEEILSLWRQRVESGKLWNCNPKKYAARLKSWMSLQFGKDENGESLSPHSLRHTFASRAIQNGVPLEIVCKLLDHASPTTTLKVYARFSQDQIDEGMKKANTIKASTATNNQGSL